MSEQLDSSRAAEADATTNKATAGSNNPKPSQQVKVVNEFRGNSIADAKFIEVLYRDKGYSLLTATPGVLNSKEINASTVENREETKESGFSMSNVPFSDEQDSSDGKFNLGSMFTYKNLRSTISQMNNPSVIGDFAVNADTNYSGSGVAGINRDGSRLQGDTNTSHSGIFMAFAPNVFKDMARGKNGSDIRYNNEEVEEVDCRDKEQPDDKRLDDADKKPQESYYADGTEESNLESLLEQHAKISSILEKYDLAEKGEATAKQKLFLTIKKQLAIKALLAAKQGIAFDLTQALAYAKAKINSSSTEEIKAIQTAYDYSVWLNMQTSARTLNTVSMNNVQPSNSNPQNSYLDPDDIEAMGHAAAGTVLAGIVTGAVKAGVDIANSIAKLGVGLGKCTLDGMEFMSKVTQAYAPEDPMDIFTEHHQQLRQEVITTSNEIRENLDFIRKHPGLIAAAAGQQITNQFVEGYHDFMEKVDHGKYYEVGNILGDIGVDAYLLGSALTAAGKLGIKGLDLAVNTTGKLAKLGSKVAKNTATKINPGLELMFSRMGRNILEGELFVDLSIAPEQLTWEAAINNARKAKEAAKIQAKAARDARVKANTLKMREEKALKAARLAKDLSNKPQDINTSQVLKPKVTEPVKNNAKTRVELNIEKDILTDAGLNQPVPLTKVELGVVKEWEIQRRQLLKKIDEIDISNVSEHLRDGLKKVTKQLQNSMTPDDLAAIIKERRGVQILKPNGKPFNHIGEWDNAKTTFEKTMNQYRFYSEHDIAVWDKVCSKTNEIWEAYKKCHNPAKFSTGSKPHKGM